MKDYLKLYAPYFYMNSTQKKNKLIFDLFILIPVENNKTIQFSNPENHRTSKTIRCKIIDGTKNNFVLNGKSFVKKHFQFIHRIKSTKGSNLLKMANIWNYEVSVIVKSAIKNVIHSE